MGRWLNKGEHEKNMEEAKDLLNKGIGMGEIKERTGLSEKDIIKAKEKMESRR